jgi:hypothetical protein
MVVTIDKSLSPPFRSNVISQLRAQLVCSAHAALCPWRDAPVPLALIQLTGSSATEVLRECQARLDSLLRCAQLPVLAPEFLRSTQYRRILDAIGWPPGRRSAPRRTLSSSTQATRPLALAQQQHALPSLHPPSSLHTYHPH